MPFPRSEKHLVSFLMKVIALTIGEQWERSFALINLACHIFWGKRPITLSERYLTGQSSLLFFLSNKFFEKIIFLFLIFSSVLWWRNILLTSTIWNRLLFNTMSANWDFLMLDVSLHEWLMLLPLSSAVGAVWITCKNEMFYCHCC